MVRFYQRKPRITMAIVSYVPKIILKVHLKARAPKSNKQNGIVILISIRKPTKVFKVLK